MGMGNFDVDTRMLRQLFGYSLCCTDRLCCMHLNKCSCIVIVAELCREATGRLEI